MIWIILQFIILSLLFVLPMTLYKGYGKRMDRFYDLMIHSDKARRLYAQVLLILLLLFHYVYTCVHPGEFGVLFSTIVCATMFSSRRTDRWLRYLLDKPRVFVRFALAALVIAFIPHLYTMAVTVAYLLLAALFYPSVRVMSEWEDIHKIFEWTKFPERFAESYFDNPSIEPSHDVDNGNATDTDNPNNDKSSKTE